MKSTLTLLSLLFFTNIVGQENYVYIENKGNTKCFFDESDPLSFLNMCKNDFVQKTAVDDTYDIGFYETNRYSDLDVLSLQGRLETILIVDMFGATNEEILVRDRSLNQNFQEWFDSIVQMNHPPEESELMLLDEIQKADLELRWSKAGYSGFLTKSNYNLYYSFENIKAILIDQAYNAFFIKHKQRIVDNEIITQPYISAAMKIPNEFSTGIGVQLNKSETKERWENMRNIALFGNAHPDTKDDFRYDFYLTDSLHLENYFALSPPENPDEFSRFNFGTKYFDTIFGLPETINIIDMYGEVNEALLIREPNSNQDFHEWFDSIVQINYPPEYSDLMLFDEKQKVDLELRWIEARANEGFVYTPNEVVLKWWDFPNPSAHAVGLYSLSLYPRDGESDSDCTFGGLVWSIDNENIRFPMMEISNLEFQEKTVEKFQKSTKTLKWVDLLLSEKAGKRIPKSEMDEKKFNELTGGFPEELILNL